MKNTSFLKNTSLGILLSFGVSLSAQQKASVVTDTKTDKNFANTTEIYKSEKASDTQVLDEIAGNFGLGDVVRISIAPPKSKPQPISVNANTNTPLNTQKTDLAVISTPATRVSTPVSQTQTSSISKKVVEQRMVSTPTVVKMSTPIIEKQEQRLVVENTPKAVEVMSVENKENNEVTPVENKVGSVSNRTIKSSNSNKSVKSSKSNSRKSFALFKNFSFKSNKRSKVKSGSKYGCYRF